jgi:hypothetical protein
MSETRRTIARDLLRALLEEAQRDVKREQAVSERLRALVRAAKTAGLGATELAEASGLSRPAVYEVLQRDAQTPAEDLDDIVLAAIAAGGATTRASLASVLRVSEDDISIAVDRLANRQVISFGTAGYDGGTSMEILTLRSEGEQLLQDQLRRSLSSRPELWIAYIAVARDEAAALHEAAEKRFGRNRIAVLPERSTSGIEPPELAIAFDVADLLGLFNAAGEAWHSLRADIPLDPAPMRISAFSLPRERSETLEAICRGIVKANPQIESQITRAITAVAPQDDEYTICVRALTEAAWTLRRSVDQKKRPPQLSTGDDAFDELQAVVGLRLDAPREKVRNSLIRALRLASDRLGPIPGGCLGSVRGPGEEPHMVAGVTPTPSDLAEIAKASGEALGHAHTATAGELDAVEALRIISGSSDV